MSTAAVAAPAALHGLGQPIPDTAHAVSVSLPSWSSNIGYEEGEDWVVSKMRNGYPRFFIHLSIVAFQDSLLEKHGRHGEAVLLFSSTPIAHRCTQFIDKYSELSTLPGRMPPRILELISQPTDGIALPRSASLITVVFFDQRDTGVARKFWQHTGDGVSSRRAEFFHRIFNEGHLVPKEVEQPLTIDKTALAKGPRRYQRKNQSITEVHEPPSPKQVQQNEDTWEAVDYARFVDERFGRNLDTSLAAKAKLAIRRRISGSLASDVGPEEASDVPTQAASLRPVQGFSEDDVYLFPCGMSAIYNTHRMMLALRGQMKSVMFGFPYTDTLKVLEKFGPGAIFYGYGSAQELDELERQCEGGERFLALFCEFPGNPLLKTPDLHRIRKLADKYDFAVVVDETIGNFLNVNVLPVADVVVSSLTKVFSGDSNVMGGSMVLNPTSRYYAGLQKIAATHYADHLWPEDAIFLERNSRDFMSRNARINENAETLADLLKHSPKTKALNYPKHSDTRENYDRYRNKDGGYSGLLSVTLHSRAAAISFYDALATAKGPSLGTNFTLSSPFVILAHYHELNWVQQLGVDPYLVRVSVGLEETAKLIQVFQVALDAVVAEEV